MKYLVTISAPRLTTTLILMFTPLCHQVCAAVVVLVAQLLGFIQVALARVQELLKNGWKTIADEEKRERINQKMLDVSEEVKLH